MASRPVSLEYRAGWADALIVLRVRIDLQEVTSRRDALAGMAGCTLEERERAVADVALAYRHLRTIVDASSSPPAALR